MKQLAIIILLISTVTSVFAETMIIDINTAVTLAKKNNIDLKRAALSLEGKRRDKVTAYNVFYPEIDGSATFAKSNLEPDPVDGYTASDTNLILGYSASFNFTPALFNAITLLKRDYQLGEISYEKVHKSIETNIKEIFYNLILIKEQISLLEDNLSNIENRYDQMKTNYNAGIVSELELLKVQVSYENFKPELNSINNTYNSILLNFKTLLGIDLDQEVFINGVIEPEINTLTVADAIDLALLNNSDLKSINKYTQFFDAQKKSTFSRDFLPLINISYSQSRILNDPFGDNRFKEDNFFDDTGKLSVSILYSLHSLFPNSSARMEQRKIEQSIKDTELQGEALIDGLKLQITNYISVLNNSIKIQEGLKFTVLLAEKSLGQVKQAYDAGTAKLIDVESAENEYKKSRLELLKEKFNYTHNLLNLEAIISPL